MIECSIYYISKVFKYQAIVTVVSLKKINYKENVISREFNVSDIEFGVYITQKTGFFNIFTSASHL